jgi:hypothetical protein
MRSSESYAVRVHSKPLGRHMGAFQPTRRVRLLRRTDGRFDEPGTSQKSGPEARLILGSRESSQSLAGSGFPQITMRLSCRLFKRTRDRTPMPRTLTNLTGATTNDKVAALPSLDMSKMGQTVVSADRQNHP